MPDTEQNASRRHHTVPQFYLRGFAAGDQIGTVKLPGDKRFIQSVRDASVIKDFYSVKGHEGGIDVIEKELAKIEGVIADILKTVASGSWPLGAEDRTSFAFFVTLQAMRVPTQRSAMENVAAQMMRLQIGAGGKQSLRRRLLEQGSDVSDELLESVWGLATQPGGPRLRMSNEAHIHQMVELAQSLLKYVAGRPWMLVRFDRRSIFTSDSPVGLISHPRDEPWPGVGYLTAWGITLPLTRKLGLLMGNPAAFIDARFPVERVREGEVDTVQSGSTAYEQLFNQNTVRNASGWLFHHPDDGKYVPDNFTDLESEKSESDIDPVPFSGGPWFRPQAN